jgi:5-methylcytosine-specific restriction endonuclease McrA
MCGICELPVGRDAKWPDPGAPTLDHVVPMSQGGGHTLANVQLAHFYCNTVKGNRLEAAC